MNKDGFLLVDKSAGMTSHDVVAIARRALGTKKVGHAGTLDPMATGLLVLGFGNGTRLLQYITEGEKRYEATIILGASTITDDAEGEILTQADAAHLRDSDIAAELEKMVGTIEQRPSSVSAVKVGGERAYARVRAGEKFELPTRTVTISSLQIREMWRVAERVEVDIEVTCGPGTFIRAIARDCGERLGVGGHLNRLRRNFVAPFDISTAISITQLKSGEFTPISVAAVADLTFAVREVTVLEENELSFGRSLSASASEELTAALSNDRRLIALLQNVEGQARPIAVFATRT